MIYILNQRTTFDDIVAGLKEALVNLNIPVKVIKAISKKSLKRDSNSTYEDLYILFGAHDYKGPLPKNYIVYQFEQTSKKGSNSARYWFKEDYFRILRGACCIWDYSIMNIQNLKKENSIVDQSKNISFNYVPLLYMPVQDRIQRVALSEKTIDVLFYGSVNPRRMKIYNDLKQIGVKVDFNWNNLWGPTLDEKISKAKIVLNIHFYDEPILETSRLSYLIANNAFVISEPSVDPILDRQFAEYLVFEKYDHLVESCMKYLINNDLRNEVADNGYQRFKSKPYQEVIPVNFLRNYNRHNQGSGSESESEDIIESDKYVDNKYIQAEMEATEDGQVLKLPDISFSQLPKVSIVTLTYNRSEMLGIAQRNFRLFNYPYDKMEWVIIDDSNDYHQEQNRKLIGRDPRVKYVPLGKHYSISEKRNMGVTEATHGIIVHMDDDDYYPPNSVLARVKLLLKYQKQGAGCVGCCQIGIYNMIENYSYLMDTPYPSEASMAYFREFWEQEPFPYKDVPEGEGIPFVHNRTSTVVNMPYMFNLIAITHNKNITGKFRTTEIDEDERYTNFFNLWDFDTQLFFLDILGKIKREQRRIENKQK